jgi:hypothetical protein
MDVNEYALEMLARQRLHEARACAARRSLARRAPRRRPQLRAHLGALLIALGERVIGTSPARVARGASHG